MSIRPLRATDRTEFVRMRMTLWPDSHASEVDDRFSLAPDQGVTLVAERNGGAGLCGFAEIELRKFADGCESSPVPYLEGIWVDGDARRSGVATALIDSVEAWCRERGFTEIGSDCDIANSISEQFHIANGFAVVGRSIMLRKHLT